MFSCIKFIDVKFTGEFFQNFTNPSFPKVYTAEPIYCLPDEVFVLFNACQGTACMMHASLHVRHANFMELGGNDANKIY